MDFQKYRKMKSCIGITCTNLRVDNSCYTLGILYVTVNTSKDNEIASKCRRVYYYLLFICCCHRLTT
jgi:hypothetical protein